MQSNEEPLSLNKLAKMASYVTCGIARFKEPVLVVSYWSCPALMSDHLSAASVKVQPAQRKWRVMVKKRVKLRCELYCIECLITCMIRSS